MTVIVVFFSVCLLSFAKKILELQFVLVDTLCVGSSVTVELMNLGVLHLPVVCTL
jgi:hypothetical protein